MTARLILSLLLVSALNRSASAAEAQSFEFFMSGDNLKEACSEPAGTIYVLGLIDGLRAQEQAGGTQWFCLPKSTSGVQLRDAVCQFIVDHPADQQEPAPYLAISALGGAFPCAARL